MAVTDLADRGDPPSAIALALQDFDMPPEEIKEVIEAPDTVIVRRYLELHRERLAEHLAERLDHLAALERKLVRSLEARRSSAHSQERGRQSSAAPQRSPVGRDAEWVPEMAEARQGCLR